MTVGGGEFSINSEFGSTLVHVTPGPWWMGEFFRGSEFVLGGRPVKMVSLPVSSELLNMLLHAAPGRLLTGRILPGREFVPGGCPGGGCPSVLSY